MKATSRYHENLYHELEQKGYQMRLLHPGQTHHFHQQQGLRAKTDHLDARTIARVLRSLEARVGYIPNEQVATYRELVRLHTQSLVRRLPVIRTRSRPSSSCFSPSSVRSLLIPAYPALWQCGNTYPDAQAVAEAGVEAVYQVLRAVPAAHFGRPTAKKLVGAAQASSGSGRALHGRTSSLRILCDQLEHTQANLQRLEEELGQLLTTDPETKGLRQMPELGLKPVAVLRAELGR
jgi:transposase